MKKSLKNVTETFQKIQDTVISNYTKIEDNFVAQYLTHEGESVADAKKRLETGTSRTKTANQIMLIIFGHCLISFLCYNVIIKYDVGAVLTEGIFTVAILNGTTASNCNRS